VWDALRSHRINRRGFSTKLAVADHDNVNEYVRPEKKQRHSWSDEQWRYNLQGIGGAIRFPGEYRERSSAGAPERPRQLPGPGGILSQGIVLCGRILRFRYADGAMRWAKHADHAERHVNDIRLNLASVALAATTWRTHAIPSARQQSTTSPHIPHVAGSSGSAAAPVEGIQPCLERMSGRSIGNGQLSRSAAHSHEQ
jgi:hypothetical protein